jgi:hypothetical protein
METTMRKLLTFLIALAVTVGVSVSSFGGSMGLLGVGGSGAPPLPGPPVFTFTDIQAGSTTSNTCTSNSLSIGTANSNRRVYVLAFDVGAGASPQAATGASFNGGAIAADVFQVIGTTPTDTMNVYLISAVVPTGTTATVTLTYGSTTFSSARFAAYTVDTTTLSSKTPVTSAQAVTVAGTSVTAQVPIATAGSSILAGAIVGFGGGSGGSITSSDAGLSNDGGIGNFIVGSANNVGVSAASHVTVGWTGASDTLLALAVLR